MGEVGQKAAGLVANAATHTPSFDTRIAVRYDESLNASKQMSITSFLRAYPWLSFPFSKLKSVVMRTSRLLLTSVST